MTFKKFLSGLEKKLLPFKTMIQTTESLGSVILMEVAQNIILLGLVHCVQKKSINSGPRGLA